jgi:hypothetical protein
MYVLPFGDTAHSTGRLLTRINLAQIILSVFYDESLCHGKNRRKDFSFSLTLLSLEQFQDNV